MTGERNRTVPIVGIGASAGGIEAFRKFFEMMPAQSGLAFVVVLHLPPNRRSLLPEILSRWTAMPIVEIVDGGTVQPDTVYVPPPGSIVTFGAGKLHLRHPEKDETPEPIPISVFFDSLAQALHENAIGIVLSGTGSDGALGLKAIKTCGGLTLAQGTEGSAPLHGGMPDSAIATGAVDIIASVEDMPRHIIAAQEVRRRVEGEGAANGASDIERLAVCAILSRELGHDFAGYKDKTFLRRVQRRMQVVGLAEIGAYIRRLDHDRSEVLMLFRDLLIGVTSFFRDVETFEALRQTVVPRLFQGKGADGTVRVWVPGCATGEEAYSIAMLLCDYAGQIGSPAPRIQVFATDIDEAAIGTARTGRYPSTLMSAIPRAYLDRFFLTSADGAYTVTKRVRELCTFSAYSLTRDPPFSRIDLISCRNLLIYLDSDLQAAIIPAFHYALVPDGILLLGSAETVSRHENLFEVLDRPHRIFRRRDTPSPPLQLHSRAIPREQLDAADATTGSPAARRGNLRSTSRANARVLERFGPAFVVVDAEGLIVQYSSRIGRFLEPPPGLPSQSALDMARGGLRPHLRAALKQAVESGRAVEVAHVPVSIPGDGTRHVTLAVDPLFEHGVDPLYLVVFLEGGIQSPDRTEAEARGEQLGSAEQRLEAELRDVQEQLQAITEEHETALEELRSSNEELHSVNEELQSTNEELETSKEEIQSINEELQTVNTQLSAKLDELDRKNLDLKNLFESTEVATIFLDRFLIVRGFTPAVANIYNLIPSDHGRPLTDIVSRLRYTGLREDVHRVLNTLEPLERRVTRDDGSMHYLMRVQPYRTPDSEVDGAVMTFVDVTSIVKAEQHQRLLVDELNHRVKNMLTVVISLATQTLRRSPTLEAFSEAFLGRVHALTAAYSLLSSESWQTVGLRDILMEELRPFLVGDGTNIAIGGPAVLLEPRAALALGMAVHELTTNAVKYGALSVPEGNVRVTWVIEPGPQNEILVLDWVETDGPPVTPPTGRGFGMMLIERGLKQDMAAEISVEFRGTGVCARLRAPLNPQATSDPEAAPHEPG
jgi:two-component system, chemotaxis family, CheB/CheR fusion protein